MSNPLSHVGQTSRPEVSSELQRHCEQAHGQQQSVNAPAAKRLPQHLQQRQADPLEQPEDQQRIRQQGETRAEDTALPAPADAD